MSRKPSDNEVIVGNGKNQRVLGPNTVIQINLKTLVIVIGLLLSGLTTAYYNLSSKISESDKKLSTQIDDLDKSLDGLKDQELKELRSKVDRISGQLDNTTRQNQNEFRQDNIVNRANESGNVENITPTLPR